MLRCSDLAIEVPGRVLCRNVSVVFEPGQLWAVLGRNGAGKSTLLHTLAGLVRPNAGSVELQTPAGLPVRDARTRARMVAVLLQIEDGTYWGTAGEYVLLGRYPHVRGLLGYSREDIEQAEAALDAVAMLSYALRRFATLSGGERQRVRIAQILAQDADTFLLDEPLQHLDLAYQAQILNLMATRAREHRNTVVMVLHEPLWIARLCTHVLILAGEGVAHHGPAEDILTRERLEHAYGCRLREIDHGAGRSFVPDV
ncbi:MAG TPA: ABC transporter ATP-binding protein [Burkholderiales bacterium]|jgi:iron complex transport system ATP-binding protein